jgi:hypothetical protein
VQAAPHRQNRRFPAPPGRHAEDDAGRGGGRPRAAYGVLDADPGDTPPAVVESLTHQPVYQPLGTRTGLQHKNGDGVYQPNLSTNAPDSHSDKIPGDSVLGILPVYIRLCLGSVVIRHLHFCVSLVLKSSSTPEWLIFTYGFPIFSLKRIRPGLDPLYGDACSAKVVLAQRLNFSTDCRPSYWLQPVLKNQALC